MTSSPNTKMVAAETKGKDERKLRAMGKRESRCMLQSITMVLLSILSDQALKQGYMISHMTTHTGMEKGFRAYSLTCILNRECYSYAKTNTSTLTWNLISRGCMLQWRLIFYMHACVLSGPSPVQWRLERIAFYWSLLCICHRRSPWPDYLLMMLRRLQYSIVCWLTQRHLKLCSYFMPLCISHADMLFSILPTDCMHTVCNPGIIFPSK